MHLRLYMYTYVHKNNSALMPESYIKYYILIVLIAGQNVIHAIFLISYQLILHQVYTQIHVCIYYLLYLHAYVCMYIAKNSKLT